MVAKDNQREKSDLPKKTSKNSPLNRVERNAEQLRTSIKSVMKLLKRTPVKNDVELEARLVEFFEYCYKNSEYPTVERMALFLGTTRVSLYNWERYYVLGERASYLLRRAKEAIAALDADLALGGAMPPILYFFRSTNYYGMKNANTPTIEDSIPPHQEKLTAQDIKKRLEDQDYTLPGPKEPLHDYPDILD